MPYECNLWVGVLVYVDVKTQDSSTEGSRGAFVPMYCFPESKFVGIRSVTDMNVASLFSDRVEQVGLVLKAHRAACCHWKLL